jgi:phenol 2-monooxygenase
VLAYTPADTDPDSVFDVKVVYQQRHVDVDLGRVPGTFLPRVGPFGLIDYEKVYATDDTADIFDLRGIDRNTGCVVVVRPDQYVAAVLPLTDTEALAAHFAPIMRPVTAAGAAAVEQPA